jgi:hypothetical protein
MKRFLFLFLLICPIWGCSSCEDEENRLPGTKPDILLGKWERNYAATPIFTFETIFCSETYEFTLTGGSLKEVRYFPIEDRYEDYPTSYFTDWSYDGKEIYFINERKNGHISNWSQPVYELTSDFFRLGSSGLYTYLKIKNTSKNY